METRQLGETKLDLIAWEKHCVFIFQPLLLLLLFPHYILGLTGFR